MLGLRVPNRSSVRSVTVKNPDGTVQSRSPGKKAGFRFGQISRRTIVYALVILFLAGSLTDQVFFAIAVGTGFTPAHFRYRGYDLQRNTAIVEFGFFVTNPAPFFARFGRFGLNVFNPEGILIGRVSSSVPYYSVYPSGVSLVSFNIEFENSSDTCRYLSDAINDYRLELIFKGAADLLFYSLPVLPSVLPVSFRLVTGYLNVGTVLAPALAGNRHNSTDESDSFFFDVGTIYVRKFDFSIIQQENVTGNGTIVGSFTGGSFTNEINIDTFNGTLKAAVIDFLTGAILAGNITGEILEGIDFSINGTIDLNVFGINLNGIYLDTRDLAGLTAAPAARVTSVDEGIDRHFGPTIRTDRSRSGPSFPAVLPCLRYPIGRIRRRIFPSGYADSVYSADLLPREPSGPIRPGRYERSGRKSMSSCRFVRVHV